MSGSPLPADPVSCLRLWLRTGDERAFAAVVEAYTGLVFNTARQCLGGDAESAREVAQNVFLTAARKAPQLTKLDGLSAWFHSTAMKESANHRRGEERRRKRQETCAIREIPGFSSPEVSGNPDFHPNTESASPSSHPSHPSPSDPEVRSHLNDALSSLKPAEREILLSRFFENRTFSAIAEARSSSPDAVRMKCQRAMNKLASWFRRRGLTAENLTLGSVLGTHWSQPAPEHLAAAIRSAIHHGGIHSSVAGTAATASSSLTAMAFAKSLTAAAAVLLALIPLHSQNGRIRQLEARISAAAAAARPAVETPNPPARRSAPEFIPIAMEETQIRLTFPLTAADLTKTWVMAGSGGINHAGMFFPLPVELEKQKLFDLPIPEIKKLLADLEPLTVGEDVKRTVRSFLLEFCLARTDPRTALENALSARLDTSVLGRIIQQWASNDPSAAQAWLEKRRDGDLLIPQRFGDDPEGALWSGVTRALAMKDLTSAVNWAEASIGSPAAPALLRGLAPAMASGHQEERFLDLCQRLPSAKAAFDAQSQLLAQVLQQQKDSGASRGAGIRLLENPRIPAGQREALVVEALRIRITDPDIIGGRSDVFRQAWALSSPESRREVLLRVLAFRAPGIDPGSPQGAKVEALKADIAQALEPVDSTRDFQFIEAIKNPDIRKSLRSEFAPLLSTP